MPPSGARRGRRPVSCNLCRERKLRCDRAVPCHNCSARDSECRFSPDPSSRQPAVKKRRETASTTQRNADADLAARLNRIESLVVNRELLLPNYGASNSNPGQARLPPRQTTRALHYLTEAVSELDASLYAQNSQNPVLSDPLRFGIRSVLHKKPMSTGNDSSTETGLASSQKIIWLPLYDEAIEMLNKFVRDVHHYIHIFHEPSLFALFDDIYNELNQTGTARTGSVLILLSICACACYAWTPQDCSQGIYTDPAEANMQTTSWIKASLDVVEHGERTAHASLEFLQGMVILFWVFFGLEGASMRARSLVTKSIFMAQNLGIPQIDNSTNIPASLTRNFTTVEAEVSRRLWWFLIASNWAHAQFTSLYGNLYTAFLKNMTMRWPCNANDVDIVNGQEPRDHPLDYPTGVSYLIQYIRLEDVCHDIFNEKGSILLAKTLEYHDVLQIDAKLQQFRRELPPFFTVDSTDSMDDNDQQYDDSLITQRFLVNLVLHRKLCQLHLPYFIKRSVEPEFAYSYNACLESASLIVFMERELGRGKLAFSSIRRRMSIKIRSIFIVPIVLVLGACVDHGDDQFTQWQELEDVLGILSEMAKKEPAAAKLLDFSLEMLTRHKPFHSITTKMAFQESTAEPVDEAMVTTDPSYGSNGMDSIPSFGTDGVMEDGDAEEQWDQILEQMGLGSNAWHWSSEMLEGSLLTL